jgi:hypothetical protein
MAAVPWHAPAHPGWGCRHDAATLASDQATSAIQMRSGDGPLHPTRAGRLRLVRGPFPHVVEAFVLTERPAGGTLLAYQGEIGADL